MAENNHYRKPSGIHRVSITVVNSSFVTTVAPADSVKKARIFISDIRKEMSDATHHVYAFRVGYGNSVTEGMSDDGEPSGTSGPPTLSVLRGSDIGDIALVTTRYFGGTKLGTGGLVRAYTKAAQTALMNLPTELHASWSIIGMDMPYALYEQTKLLVQKHQGKIVDETFAADVTILAKFLDEEIDAFVEALNTLSSGRIEPVLFDDI